MRPILYLLLLFVVLSCKKDEDTIQDRLAGKWELRKIYGGIMNGTPIPPEFYPPGNGNVYEFTKTTLSVYINGQLYGSGTYDVGFDSASQQNFIF